MSLAKWVQAFAQVNPPECSLVHSQLKKKVRSVPYKTHTNIYRLYLYNSLIWTVSSLSMSISKGNSMSVIISEAMHTYSNIQTVQIRF